MTSPESSPPAWPPPGWSVSTYRRAGRDHTYYEIGDGSGGSRASVLLLHEFPGITRELVELANTLSARFRVVVPSLLGRDGSPTTLGSLREVCVRREVHAFGADGASRGAAWLRQFATEHVGRGGAYGVIGMCFTGNYALALAVDPQVKAAVVAQPAMPVAPRGGLGLSQADRDMLAVRGDLCVRGLRFRHDLISSPRKLSAAERLLGPERMTVSTLTEPRSWRHSTLTGVDRNRDAVLFITEFLAARL